MAKTEVRLPPLGDDVDKPATVSFFFHEVGEEVNQGEDLVEMVTEKATVAVPSPVSGKLLSIQVTENSEVRTDDVLAVIETPD
jgi:pyruvate dehydrogenase E2 component (dihydrolipoamide acetyltransferase)